MVRASPGLGHAQTPKAIASAMTPAVCATAASERRSESSVSGASSAALRMRRAQALRAPTPPLASGRRSVRNSSPWRSLRSTSGASDQLDDLLAEVLPLQQAEKRLGRRRDAFG